MAPDLNDWSENEANEWMAPNVTFEGLSEEALINGGRIHRWSESGKRTVLAFCAENQVSRRNRPSGEQTLALVDKLAVLKSRDGFEEAAKKVLSLVDRTVVGGAIHALTETKKPDGTYECVWYAFSEGWFKDPNWNGDCSGPPNTDTKAWEERHVVPQRHSLGHTNIIKAAVHLRGEKLKQISLEKMKKSSPADAIANNPPPDESSSSSTQAVTGSPPPRRIQAVNMQAPMAIPVEQSTSEIPAAQAPSSNYQSAQQLQAQKMPRKVNFAASPSVLDATLQVPLRKPETFQIPPTDAIPSGPSSQKPAELDAASPISISSALSSSSALLSEDDISGAPNASAAIVPILDRAVRPISKAGTKSLTLASSADIRADRLRPSQKIDAMPSLGLPTPPPESQTVKYARPAFTEGVSAGSFGPKWGELKRLMANKRSNASGDQNTVNFTVQDMSPNSNSASVVKSLSRYADRLSQLKNAKEIGAGTKSFGGGLAAKEKLLGRMAGNADVRKAIVDIHARRAKKTDDVEVSEEE